MKTSQTPLKVRLNVAFSKMRAIGLLANQNFMCCCGCAGCALAQTALERAKDGKPVTGYCFYTRQDGDKMRDCKDFCLAFGGDFGTKKLKPRLTDVTVGGFVMGCLKEAGVKATWNGNPDTRIRVQRV